MSVISSTRGNPQASDVAVQTATPMLGGASREDLQTVISSVDAEAAKLFEDRNIQLVDGGLITFTGTALQFTEALKLHINSQVAGGAPTVIDLAATTRSLSASGRMLYAVINRSAGTAVVTADATTLPAVTSANQEVVLIAKRVDAGDGTQRCYFRNGSTYNAGNTARLGSSGSGSGSGEINEIANSSDATNWVASGAGITVATTTTASDLPLNGVISTAIKITPVSGTDYARYRWTAATALKGKKLKVEWFQHALAGYAAGDLKLEVYKNSASDYTGSYTEFPLSTDISGTSSIPAGDGKYTSSFDMDPTADYYELRIVRVAGTSALALANLIVGPGIQPQGAVVEAPATLAVTYDNLGTVANSDVTYTRYGTRAKVQGRVTTGTIVAGTPAINLPSGFTLLTGSGGLSTQASGIVVGSARVIVASATETDEVPNYDVFYDGSSATKLFITERSQSSALKKHNATDIFANGDILEFDFDVPVSEFIAGTLNVASNDVEYLTNTNTSTSVSDTTSFGYSSGGAAIVAVSSAGATVKKRTRAQRPMGANKGRPKLQVSPDGTIWLAAESILPYMEAGSQKYGMRIVAGGTAATDMDVEFGGDGANGTEAWSTYTTWSWRVVLEQPGMAIGFGLADATSSGLMSFASQTLAGAKTWNDTMTFKINSGATTVGSYDASGIWTIGASGSTQTHTTNGNKLILQASAATAATYLNVKSGSLEGGIGISGSSSALFTGAAAGDVGVFSNGHRLAFSVDAGNNTHAYFETTGAFFLPTNNPTEGHLVFTGTSNARINVKEGMNIAIDSDSNETDRTFVISHDATTGSGEVLLKIDEFGNVWAPTQVTNQGGGFVTSKQTISFVGSGAQGAQAFSSAQIFGGALYHGTVFVNENGSNQAIKSFRVTAGVQGTAGNAVITTLDSTAAGSSSLGTLSLTGTGPWTVNVSGVTTAFGGDSVTLVLHRMPSFIV